MKFYLVSSDKLGWEIHTVDRTQTWKTEKGNFPRSEERRSKKPDLVFAGFNAMRIVFQFYIQIWDDCVIEHEVARTASKNLTLELHDAPRLN